MKNKLSKLFSRLPIMYSVMLRSYRILKRKVLMRGAILNLVEYGNCVDGYKILFLFFIPIFYKRN